MSRGWTDGLDGGSGAGGLTREVEVAAGVPSPQSQVTARSSLSGSLMRAPKATPVPACAMTVGIPSTDTVPLVSPAQRQPRPRRAVADCGRLVYRDGRQVRGYGPRRA